VLHSFPTRRSSDLQLIELLDDRAEAFIDTFKLSRKMRIVPACFWPFAGSGLLFELRDKFRFAVKPRVNRVVTQVEKERPIFVPLDKLDCFEIAPVDKVFPAGQALLDFAVEVVRVEIAATRDSAIFRDDCLIKAMHRRREFLCPVVSIACQMPLADYAGYVSGVLQSLGQSNVLSRKVILIVGPEIIGNANPGRVLPRHQGGTIRRANRCGSVRIGKTHSLLCEPVEIRRFVESVAVAAQLGPAQIVSKDKNNVRLTCRFGCKKRQTRQIQSNRAQSDIPDKFAS